MPLRSTTLSALAAAAVLLSAGCAAAPATPLRAAGGEAGGLARPADCPLELLYKAPERPYEVLGELRNHVMAVPAGGAAETLRPQGCALGADAVIVTRSQVLNILDHVMVEGTAIRFKLPPTTPPASAAPAAPATPPQ